jgi:shikimate 5-dehydrogenase
VYDLVYNPPLTRLLKDAAAAGCDTIGGLDMLVAQAEDQFDWWVGRRPGAGLMRQAAMARLGMAADSAPAPGQSAASGLRRTGQSL